MFQVNLKHKEKEFSGPLDLLLNLIYEQKLDINDISLSSVTEQYLNYLEGVNNINVEELADFLLIASKLLFLKSKLLLPNFVLPEDEIDIKDQLKLYEQFVKASKILSKKWLDNKQSYYRLEPPKPSSDFVKPVNLDVEVLNNSMKRIIKRLAPLKPILPQSKVKQVVSLQAKIRLIRNILNLKKHTSFSKLIAENKTNRADIVVSFLALLELSKQNVITIRQERQFGDILISKI